MRKENPSLVPNFSFEYDEDGDGKPDGWDFELVSGNPTSGRSSTERRHGLYSAYITCLTTEEGRLNTKDFIEVTDGERYVLNALAKGSVSASNALNLYIQWYDKNQSYLGTSWLDVNGVDIGTSWTLSIFYYCSHKRRLCKNTTC